MVFSLCCEREGLYKSLLTLQIFILTGVVYYYFQKSVGKTAPDYEIAGESPQPIGETLRPVWGPMDKCYPVTTQRRKVKSGKNQASEASAPRAMGGQSDAAPKEETDVLSQEEQEKKKDHQGVAEHPSESPVAESKEERPVGWGPQLLRKLWPGWLPGSDAPKMQNHE